MASLNDAIDMLLECVCTRLAEAGRPVCECYQSIGQPIYQQCCRCSGGNGTGALIGGLENMYPVNQDLLQVSRVESCRRGAWGADVALYLSRCHPTISSGGTIDTTKFSEAAHSFNDDAVDVRKALTCCDVRLMWRSIGVESDPAGGCSYLVARVTIAVD